MNWCTRVFLKSCATPMIVPAGLTASVGDGTGRPSERRRFGSPPEAPLLVTGPKLPTNGGFFISDCDM